MTPRQELVKEAVRVLEWCETGYIEEAAPMNYGKAFKIVTDVARDFLNGELVEKEKKVDDAKKA
jgi:hypothetical protein